MAKPSKRYFLLDEPYLAVEIPRMMCRVVQDVQLPLFKYTPVEPLTLTGVLGQQERPHRPCDLIANILPEPSRTTNRKDFLSAVSDKYLRAKISKVFGFGKGANDGQKVALETKEVRRYSLNNPGEYFNALTKDELYKRDVCAFLKETSEKAYFVIGFLTTSNATWTHDDSGSSTLAVDAAVPVSTVAAGFGVPVPPIVDPSFTIQRNARYAANTHHDSPDEEIFAVAYAPVKTHKFGFGKTKAVQIGRAKTAGANHLAFGDSDDEEDDENEVSDIDDDEDGDGSVKRKEEFDGGEIQLDENDGIFDQLLEDDGIEF